MHTAWAGTDPRAMSAFCSVVSARPRLQSVQWAFPVQGCRLPSALLFVIDC